MFCRTLGDIYSKCWSIDVVFVRMDRLMFALIFGFGSGGVLGLIDLLTDKEDRGIGILDLADCCS